MKEIKDEQDLLNNLQKVKQDLYKIGKVRLMQDEDIYDAIQETILIAYKNVNEQKSIRNFKSWIIRVLINECNHIYKKHKKQIEVIEKELADKREKVNSLNTIEEVESKISFDMFLRKMKYKDRMIISLYYSSHFTIKVISSILCINENTIKTRLVRIKKEIQKQIEEGNI